MSTIRQNRYRLRSFILECFNGQFFSISVHKRKKKNLELLTSILKKLS